LLDHLCLLSEAFAFVIELHNAIYIGLHVAIPTVLFDSVQMFPNESGVQHGRIPCD
jgi:hypothetical protein